MPGFKASSRYFGSLKKGKVFQAPARSDDRFPHVMIHPSAEIAEDVEIGPFSIIGPNCRIARGNRINNNVSLCANVELGESNEIYPGAVIGCTPQDKKYCGEDSRVIMGEANVIRENVTINSGTTLGDGSTEIGSRSLIMAGCHIAHDCIIGSDVTMANNVLLGGHVHVESCASFGGLAAVHHFVTIGSSAFVGGLTRVTQDVPPYMLVEGNPSKVWSINKVGLKRRGISPESLQVLKIAHCRLFRSAISRSDTARELLEEYPAVPELRRLVDFLAAAAAGNQGRSRQPLDLAEPPPDWNSLHMRR